MMSPLIESIVKASPEQLAQISQELVSAGDMIEKRTGKTSPEWFAVTRAAVLIDGLRTGLVSLQGGCHA